VGREEDDKGHRGLIIQEEGEDKDTEA